MGTAINVCKDVKIYEIVVAVLILTGCGTTFEVLMNPQHNKDYQENEGGWKVSAAVSPEDAKVGKTLTVEYTNEFGATVAAKPKVVFENKTQYRLVMPSETTTLEKNNVTAFKIIK